MKSLSTSPELFVNMKGIPDEDSAEYLPFFQAEEDKIRYGVTINGVHIHGWLYWYLCHWHIYFDVEDIKNSDVIRAFRNPQFRDNEWMIAEHIKKAEDEKKGLLVFGSRRIGKSMLESSWIGRSATIYEGSENIIASTTADDLSVLTSATSKGLGGVHPYFQYQHLKYDWSKEVSLGVEAKQGKKYEFSRILIRNLAKGVRTEVLAGTTPKALVIDEIGKDNIMEAFVAGIPGFTTPFGWRCMPLLSGCVCAGTKVWTNAGVLVNIEDLTPNEGIIGFDVKKQQLSKENITYWQPPHEKECYRITTNLGRILECSLDHPILFRSREEHKRVRVEKGKRKNIRKIYFKEAQYLKAGNQIAIIDSVPIFGKEDMWQPRLMGMLIGDGSYGLDKTPVFSNCDAELNLFVDETFDTVVEKSYTTKDGRLYRETRIRNICPELRKLGIYGQTKIKKTLPKDIDKYTKTSICELLAGLFDTDGCVHAGSRNHIVTLSSISEYLMVQVRDLLHKIGIHSSVSFVKPNFKNPIDRNGYYRLLIADRRSLLCFADNIPLMIGYKKEKLNKIVTFLSSKKDQIPEEVKNLRFDTIKKVEYIGIQSVYNLTAGITHTYIAGGIVTHNTGGSFKPNSDAQQMFEEPEVYNFLAVEWPGRTRKYGLFMPGKFRMEGKVKTKFGDFLKNNRGILIPANSELNTIEFYETDEAKAKSVTSEEIRKAELSKTPQAAVKSRMYYPENPEDCFLSDSQNPFPAEAIQQHLTYLNSLPSNGDAVDLYRDENGKVKFSFNTKKKEILDFPATNTTMKDAPIMMYEPPCSDAPPYGLYIAGGDPYNQSISETSPSLGTIHIYKRLYDLINGTYQNMIVASFASRPKEMRDWHKTVEMLLELYNANCMLENAGTNFIEYMANKHKSHLLADGYSLLKEISPNSTVNKPKGLPPTPLVINHCMALLLDYCNDEIVGADDKGNKITKLGVTRIKDKMLLIEMLNYMPETNCDRIVSFRHVLAYDTYLQKISPLVKYVDESEDVRPPKRLPQTPFNNRVRSPFMPRRRKLSI